jgi:hypothetical protein
MLKRIIAIFHHRIDVSAYKAMTLLLLAGPNMPIAPLEPEDFGRN